MSNESQGSDRERLVRRHRDFGWWSLLVFLTMGLLLESFHAFKLGWYLDVGNETRRLMLQLAHTHGTLFGLVHLAFSAGLLVHKGVAGRRARRPA